MNMHEIKSLSHEYSQRFIYEIESLNNYGVFMELWKNHDVNKH